jgi:preprotein translocase subunit SecF
MIQYEDIVHYQLPPINIKSVFTINVSILSREIEFMKYCSKLFVVFFAILLASLVGCASTSVQEGTGEFVDNTVITTKVKAAIFNESSLKVSEINVETFKGSVQLSGFVDTQANIDKAGEIALRVKGVKSVKNDILLK